MPRLNPEEHIYPIIRQKTQVQNFPPKLFEAILTTTGNAVSYSSEISGECPCLRCSRTGTNSNSSISWINQMEACNLSSSSNFRAQYVQSYLASEFDGDSIAGTLVKTKQSPTDVSEINRRQCREDPEPHSECSQALNPRDRQVRIRDLSEMSFTAALLHTYPLTYPFLQTPE